MVDTLWDNIELLEHLLAYFHVTNANKKLYLQPLMSMQFTYPIWNMSSPLIKDQEQGYNLNRHKDFLSQWFFCRLLLMYVCFVIFYCIYLYFVKIVCPTNVKTTRDEWFIILQMHKDCWWCNRCSRISPWCRYTIVPGTWGGTHTLATYR